MIIFIPDKNKKYLVHNSITKEYYPKDRIPVSRTQCLLSLTYGTVKKWLSDGKFKIEEI